MSALDKVYALFRAYVIVSEKSYAHLRIYDDGSTSILKADGTTIVEFDTFEEGIDELIALIIEAIK